MGVLAAIIARWGGRTQRINCRIVDENGEVVKISHTAAECDRWFKKNDPEYRRYAHRAVGTTKEEK